MPYEEDKIIQSEDSSLQKALNQLDALTESCLNCKPYLACPIHAEKYVKIAYQFEDELD